MAVDNRVHLRRHDNEIFTNFKAMVLELNGRIHDTYKVKTINKNLSLAGIMKWKIFP